MSRAWASGSTRAWRRTRALILQRDGWTCRLRIPDICTDHATCVHHTQGRAITGDDPGHLIAACAPCNLHIGDPQRQPDPPPRPMTRW